MNPRPARRGPAVGAGLAAACVALAGSAASAAPAGLAASPSAVDTTATLVGRVTLATSGAPADDARVELLVRGHATVTDSLGRFRLEGLEAGDDTLAASRLGGQRTTLPVRIEPGGTTRVAVELEPRVFDLGGLEVTVEGPVPTRFRRLADRIERGVGQYVTRDELDEHAGRLSFAFRGMTGVQVTHGGGTDFRVQFRDPWTRGYCDPQLFVDGRPQPGVSVDAYDPDDVAVVEVYRADVVPGEFVTWESRGCGVVLLWTRSFVR